MASLDEVLSSMPDMGGEEDSALDFLIDEDLRIITVPERGVVLGVEGDKDVNRVRFRMNRFYNGSDLSEFQIRINYQNADGDRNYFTVLEKTVEGNAFSFIWTVAADATAAKGTVQFVVNCFTADSDGVVQKAYHTTLGVANVLEGLESYEGGDIPEIVDYLTHLKNDLMIYSGTLVTGAEQSAAAASNSAAEAAKAERNAKSYANAADARNSASAASNSAAAAGTSEQNARGSAEGAASSASAAKSSETKAGSSVTTAASSANAAKSSATDAASSANAAKSSATDAASSASAASSSAKAAAESAAVAKAAVSTDKTLTFDGAPADAKATGDALAKRYTKAEADKKFVTPNTLPAATATTLGGVKIGPGLTMDDDGTLSAAEQYTLTKEAITAVLGFTPTKITMGTEDLTAGISPLETGTVYLVYSTASSDEAIGDTDVHLPEPEEPVPDEGVAP